MISTGKIESGVDRKGSAEERIRRNETNIDNMSSSYIFQLYNTLFKMGTYSEKNPLTEMHKYLRIKRNRIFHDYNNNT